MKKYLSVLEKSFLFQGADEDCIMAIIRCMEGYTKSFEKNQIIYNLYDHIEYAGIVLTGELHTVMLNSCNNEYVVRRFIPGDLFGSAYACVPTECSDVQIIAQKDCEILFLKLSNLFLPKAVSCPNASRATANLLRETSKMNIFQTRKVQILTQKHIRDRLLIYLHNLKDSKSVTGNVLTLPFNRQALANYLGVERSALSREMCRMKEEGLIDFEKNEITLLSGFY